MPTRGEWMEVVYINNSKVLAECKPEPCVMAVGFFDGVHLGHKKIIEKAKEIAQVKKLTFAVMTFFPHPSQVIETDRKVISYLSPLPSKMEIFSQLGVEKLYIVKFDKNFSELSDEDFVNQYLKGLMCKHVVAGFDFTYGFKGKGNMEKLKNVGTGFFDVTTIPKIQYKQEKISSSMIRKLLESGLVSEIPHYLGDYYRVSCLVKSMERGDADNNFIFKAQIDQDYFLPKPGIYKIQIKFNETFYNGLCNITNKTLKPYLFDGVIDGLDRIAEKNNVQLRFIEQLLDQPVAAAYDLFSRTVI
ncbi:riboflavin kinase/FMN adenylyltransferase [Aeribacillus sp. SP014]